ncbi:hypothetical protein [Hungatella hathewayi]|uniref:hypothetical protein n=1 Tax=Hungatella hathewayi TaxID=154046 RepID=UPI00356AECDA
MKDGKFKNILLDTYEKSQGGNLIGIVYGAILTIGYSEIEDIYKFVEFMNPDMLHLKSKLTDYEIDVYSWELEDYKVKRSEKTIYIKVKNKPEIPIMY